MAEMKKQSYMRVSIGALFVFMTAAAVLLNQEVKRAKAVETTAKRIEAWQGYLHYRTRAYIPNFLANVLPKSFTQEIVGISLAVLTLDGPEKLRHFDRYNKYAVILAPNELDDMLELGALDNLTFAVLRGNAIHYSFVSRICKTPSIKQCMLFRVGLSHDEVMGLRNNYPNIIFADNITNRGG